MAISAAQAWVNAAASGSATTKAISINSVGAGNLLVLTIAWFKSSTISTISSVQDDLGNSLTKLGNTTQTTGPVAVAIYALLSATSGNRRVTVTFSASSECSLSIREYKSSGSAAFATDGYQGQAQSSVTAWTSGATGLTPGTSADLAVGVHTHNNNLTTTATSGSGYTVDVCTEDNSGSQSLASEDQILSSSSAIQAKFTTNNSDSGATGLALFKEVVVNGNATLTGAALTASPGSLSTEADVILSGASLASAEGTFAPTGGGNVTLAGQALSLAPGTITATSAVVSGLSLATSAGVSSAVSAPATGAQLITAQGSVSATGLALAPLTGLVLSAAEGSLSAITPAVVSGASLTASPGTLAAQPFALLSQLGLTWAPGGLGTEGDANASPAGLSLSAAEGTLAPTDIVAVSITGLSMAVSTGALTFQLTSAIAVPGEGAALAQGALSATGGGTATISGASLRAVPGAFTQAGILRISEPATWVFAEDFGQPAESTTEDIISGAVSVAESYGFAGFSTVTKIGSTSILTATYFGVGGFSIKQG